MTANTPPARPGRPLSDEEAASALTRPLSVQGRDRCAECSWHEPTMGHAPDCSAAPTCARCVASLGAMITRCRWCDVVRDDRRRTVAERLAELDDERAT